MLAPVDKVDLGGINHQQVTGLVMKEEVLVTMRYSREVLAGDPVLEPHILLRNSLLERLQLRLLVYH